ncbi:11379_t:CDS:10 [Funneliformis geosporum]|uniref:Ubiquitin carboxyl-terminal hydrolase n=1 Tax=Funneliformis geosporum TaxID=1117311 RepID=A0A9W4SCE9_9GLOM|nr:11379_t:CDS:10 [Funneliformis geosporum]CAI2164027.1 5731_t:CDS:10 [Funneliformis geosporum]
MHSQKVPFNIGFPPLRRGGVKIKSTLSKPQECSNKHNISFSQAAMKAMQITSPNTAFHFISTVNQQTIKAVKHSTSNVHINGKSPTKVSENNKNNDLNNGLSQVAQKNNSVILSSNNQSSSERSTNENSPESQPNSNGVISPKKSSTKRWADLFPKVENSKPVTVLNDNSKSNTKPPDSHIKSQKPQKLAVPLTNGRPKVGGLAGLLKDFNPSFDDVTMGPRGLINNGNMCFMNAILQTLSHCPPFCNLLALIDKEVAHNFNSKTPLVDSLVMFINEYKQTKRHEGVEEFGEALSPEYVYDALRGLKRFDSMKGRQEDAEEFLGFLLDGLHEEFLAALKKDNPLIQQFDKTVKDDGWMEVGPKNRTSFTRTTDIEETPISHIFGGKFRSELICPGSADSITLQPYQSLQLDIQPDDVKTIGDALKNLTVPEYVDDFYSPKNGLVRATKRLYIEELPPILTLHLKRFVYDNVGGAQKLSKHIGYSTTLSIQPEIFAPTRRPKKAVEYRLFGVVYHHGKSATGGHYTADILRKNSEWHHVDDTAISKISSEEVAAVENPTQPTDRSAYILFYMKN